MRLERDGVIVDTIADGIIIACPDRRGVALNVDEAAWLMTAALPAAIVAMRPAPENVRPVASPIDGQLPLG